MLTIKIVGEEFFDETDSKFFSTEDVIIDLEHSLVSLSKWESKHEKPFLGKSDKTSEELLDYIKCMVVTKNIDPEILNRLSEKNVGEIDAYLDSKQSATTFGEMPETKGRGEIITSELIYYWMVAFNIPFECEKWHLNRLFSLIRICNIKNSKTKKMSKGALSQRYKELNAQRKAQLGTSG